MATADARTLLRQRGVREDSAGVVFRLSCKFASEPPEDG